MVPSFAWYWLAIPDEITNAARAAMSTPISSIHAAYWLAGLIAAGLLLFGVILASKLQTVTAIALMVSGLGFFGGFEWFRESLRKPFVITGYMYGNGLEVAKSATYEREGYLEHIAFRTGDDGADLFRRVCRSCHTMNGYKPLAPAFAGTDQAFMAAIVGATGALRGNMPPFHGTEAEAEMIAAHIHGQIDQRHLREIYGLSGVALGEKVYELRCGKCHVVGGFNDKSSSLAALDPEECKDFLEIAGDMSENMPAFTGDDIEREALAQYMATFEQGEGNDSPGL
jgi:mono/diheme cytochrome c family protein